MNNTYIILSAGASRSSKRDMPKSLFKYKGRPVLKHQLDCIHSVDSKPNILVVIGYGYQKILEYKPDCRLIFNENFSTNNQSDSLVLALREARYSNLWIIHGDIVFSSSIFRLPNTKKPMVSYVNKHNLHSSKIGICHMDEKLLNMEYGIDDKWSQVSYIPKTSLKDFYLSCRPGLFTHEVLNNLNSRQPINVYENKQASILEIEK